MSELTDNLVATSAESRPKRPGGGKQRACIVRYDEHPGDSRIENQAQALYEDGFSVDIICMRWRSQPFTSVSNDIRIIRLPTLKRLRGGILLYAAEYGIFFLFSFIVLSFLQLWRRYSVVLVCNLPDFLVFSAIIPKLFGAKVLLDFRESMIEMYATKFDMPLERWPIQILAKVEQACVRFADLTVTCTEHMRQATIRRGTPADKIFVMLNSVDPKKYYKPRFPEPTYNVGSKFNIITHGSIIPRYGHDTLIKSMQILRAQAPEARLVILGDGQQRTAMEELAHTLQLDDVVQFLGFVPSAEVLGHLRNADVGAVTMIRNMETDLIHTLKMQEYMILGIPVVISRTSAIEGYFDETSVQFFEASNPADLASAFLRLRNNPALRLQLARNAYKRCEQYKASDQKRDFSNRVWNLILASNKSHVTA